MAGNPGGESHAVMPRALFEDAVAHHKRGDHMGAIELYKRPLSQGLDHPMSIEEPKVRSYQPSEGMVVLYPFYFYHRTEPFTSQDKRISITFDILPLA